MKGPPSHQILGEGRVIGREVPVGVHDGSANDDNWLASDGDRLVGGDNSHAVVGVDNDRPLQ